MRVVMWSGPRNLSTAMMRSFGARADATVADEPFYAAYLAATGADHPMREAVLEAGETDPHAVAEACARPPEGAGLRYEKHMTHHMLPGFPLDWMDGARIAFLIRDPAAVAASYAAKRESCGAGDIGLVRQWALYEWCAERYGPPPVIDAADVRRAPRAALSALCAALGLPFDEAMLSWPPGRRETDGVWAEHWYGAVERSTGFAPPDAAAPQVPSGLAAVVAEARPIYERLRERALRVEAIDN
jgi:hypothetical protein